MLCTQYHKTYDYVAMMMIIIITIKQRIMYCKFFSCSQVEKCNDRSEITVDNQAYVDKAFSLKRFIQS
jgi:hypothetical protein